MNNPDNNPYSDSSPTPANQPAAADKGTVLSGFFIGWGLMIGSIMLTGFVISFLSAFAGFMNSYNNPLSQMIGFIVLLMPIGIIIGAMVWFGKKGKSKTVKGIAAAIGSMIALVLLLVAACFGILAMDGGSGFH